MENPTRPEGAPAWTPEMRQKFNSVMLDMLEAERIFREHEKRRQYYRTHLIEIE